MTADSSLPDFVEILAIVPARGGSKGIPSKNIRDLAGKPLIAYSIEAAHDAEHIDRVLVSTDSEEIASVAEEFKAEVPFLRPPELAGDLTPDYPVIEHCLSWLEKNQSYAPDIVVHLRPTGPLRTGEELDEAIEVFQRHPEADSLRSVEEPHGSPFKMWRPDGEYITPFIELSEVDDSFNAPRQVLPTVYQTTSDIGLCRRETITVKHSIIGDTVIRFELNRPTVDIDDPIDLELAEIMISRGSLNWLVRGETSDLRPSNCSFCNGCRFEQIFSYDSPLENDPNYSFFDTIEFYREVWECLGCGHLHIRPDFDISGIYEDDYMDSNYGSLEGIHQEYERIMNLPRDESNNIQRVENIHRFLTNRSWFETNNRYLFDVGTGLGVFPGLMKQHGWECTVLDPDRRAVEHARKHIGVTAHHGILSEETPVEAYDFVSLIKILEHVKDPKQLLELGNQFLSESGICYIEVPDGPIAANEGPHRMEFTSTHYHVFSPESITRLISSTGMNFLELERVHEPSGKYTLRVFCE